MAFQGLYLNLDRAQARRIHMEKMLSGHGLADRYRRLAAVDGTKLDPTWDKTKAGAKGCYLSHVAALREAAAFDGITHVLEDDVVLSSQTVPFLESEFASQALAQFDIVFLSLWVDYPNLPGLVARCRAIPSGSFQLLDVLEARISSMDSYIVNRRTAAKLHRLLETVGPLKPVDNMLHHMARLREVKAALVLPFVTVIEPSIGAESSIVQIPFDRYQLLTIARCLVSVDAQQVVLPAAEQVAVDQRPTLEFLRSLMPATGDPTRQHTVNPA